MPHLCEQGYAADCVGPTKTVAMLSRSRRLVCALILHALTIAMPIYAVAACASRSFR